jgi:hypothetical protein
MNRKVVLLIGTGVVVLGVLLAAPFLLWGEKPTPTTAAVRVQDPAHEVIVYSPEAPEGRRFPGLAAALAEMNARVEVGSVVAKTAVYGESVIIARNHTQWRTVPEDAVFWLAETRSRVEVFLDRAEFAAYAGDHPECARPGAQAMDLTELLRLLVESQAAGKSL